MNSIHENTKEPELWLDTVIVEVDDDFASIDRVILRHHFLFNDESSLQRLKACPVFKIDKFTDEFRDFIGH